MLNVSRDGRRAKAEVVKRFNRAERCRDRVIREEEERPDDAEDSRATSTGGVDAPAVGIKPADVCVRPPNGEDHQAHRADEPEAGPSGDQKRKAEDVKPA